jgi:hypothetical protein
MKIQIGHEPSITVGYKCFACWTQLSISAGYKDPKDKSEYYTDKDVKAIASKLGWCRRQFHPSVNPWFCSRECAVNSRIAKDLTEYWMVENLK